MALPAKPVILNSVAYPRDFAARAGIMLGTGLWFRQRPAQAQWGSASACPQALSLAAPAHGRTRTVVGSCLEEGLTAGDSPSMRL